MPSADGTRQGVLVLGRGADLRAVDEHARRLLHLDDVPVGTVLRDVLPRVAGLEPIWEDLAAGVAAEHALTLRCGSAAVVDLQVTLRPLSGPHGGLGVSAVTVEAAAPDGARPPDHDDALAGLAMAVRTAAQAGGDDDDALGMVVATVLGAARAQLGFDVAWLSRLEAGAVVPEAVDGVSPFGVAARPEGETLCGRVLRGVAPAWLPRAAGDARVRDLPEVAAGDVGAYVAVPVRLADGRVRGMLCCAARAERPRLDGRDVAFVHVLAEVLAGAYDRAEQAARERTRRAAAATEVLLRALGARDRATAEHSDEVLELALRCGVELGLGVDELAEVGQVALLHDVGKLGVPDGVLAKPGPLTGAEWDEMCRHPELGAELVASIDSLRHLAPSVRAEHERWDGRGYPDGLAGEAIPMASRVVFACDAFHAMTSDRPYRAAMSVEIACRELEMCAGTQFDPAVVRALLAALDARVA